MVFQEARLERTIATRARVKEGTMDAGGGDHGGDYEASDKEMREGGGQRNRLEDDKEESHENDEEMFDQVFGCLQEREAATFGASSGPETAAPETADWPAPGLYQPMPCFCNSGGVTAAMLDQQCTTGQCHTTDKGRATVQGQHSRGTPGLMQRCAHAVGSQLKQQCAHDDLEEEQEPELAEEQGRAHHQEEGQEQEQDPDPGKGQEQDHRQDLLSAIAPCRRQQLPVQASEEGHGCNNSGHPGPARAAEDDAGGGVHGGDDVTHCGQPLLQRWHHGGEQDAGSQEMRGGGGSGGASSASSDSSARSQLCQMQEKVFQEARLERTIATRARVKEGTMGQGGAGEQAGEEDTRGLNPTLCLGDGVRHSLGFTAPQRQGTQEIVYLWIMIYKSEKVFEHFKQKLKLENLVRTHAIKF